MTRGRETNKKQKGKTNFSSTCNKWHIIRAEKWNNDANPNKRK